MWNPLRSMSERRNIIKKTATIYMPNNMWQHQIINLQALQTEMSHLHSQSSHTILYCYYLWCLFLATALLPSISSITQPPITLIFASTQEPDSSPAPSLPWHGCLVRLQISLAAVKCWGISILMQTMFPHQMPFSHFYENHMYVFTCLYELKRPLFIAYLEFFMFLDIRMGLYTAFEITCQAMFSLSV